MLRPEPLRNPAPFPPVLGHPNAGRDVADDLMVHESRESEVTFICGRGGHPSTLFIKYIGIFRPVKQFFFRPAV